MIKVITVKRLAYLIGYHDKPNLKTAFRIQVDPEHWAWCSRVAHVEGSEDIRIYLNFGGYYKDHHPDDLIVVDVLC